MKIILAQHYGMCFGVRDAIAEAERLAQSGPLTILGQLVHNPLVRERLAARGVAERGPHDTIASGTRTMITAHGTSDKQRETWRAAGLQPADGTCPLVRRAHSQLRRLVDAGYFPVVIGKAGHIEVIGLTGDFPDAVVISSPEDVGRVPVWSRYGVISQTTQPVERVVPIVAALRCAHPQAEVQFVDTVCKPTKDRQQALRSLVRECDLVVVVGGRTSNNTRELVAACDRGGRRSIHVERADELQIADFLDVQTVGVTAGTSTLGETVDAVVRRLEEIARELARE